jgi:hypothetical protein
MLLTNKTVKSPNSAYKLQLNYNNNLKHMQVSIKTNNVINVEKLDLF